jgi:hypothetical protein
MRILSIALSIAMLFCCAATFTSCQDSGTTATGSLIADFDLDGLTLLASSDSALERLCSAFEPRAAMALADLGFESNCYPFNQFTGPTTVQGGLQVAVIAPDQSFVAQGVTSDAGRVSFNDLAVGYLTLMITGEDGYNYFVPVQVSENTTSRTRVLIYRQASTGDIVLVAKTIHDTDGDGVNDDSFSYSVFNRPRNETGFGVVHLHLGNETKIDGNGDGDFTDSKDRSVVEPDDDGVKSDLGDGDEDNDGLNDMNDPDIDGDGLLNAADDDIDGDGILNADDPYPDGITPLDDFTPPGLSTAFVYPGIEDVAVPEDNTATVYFAVGYDPDNPPVTYIIYYSTTSPIDFGTAPHQYFHPVGDPGADEILSDNVVGLITGQTYYFAVRVMDSAQPPNMDANTGELAALIETTP